MSASAQPVRYAGFWKRFHAYKIDLFIVTLLSLLAGWMVGDASAEGMEDFAHELQTMQEQLGAGAAPANAGSFVGSLVSGLILAMVISAVYNIVFIAGKHQATPGKRYCGIKVVMEDGSKPSWAQSALRHFASGLTMATGGLGFLTIVYTREKLAIHDALARTRVIFKEPS